MVTSPLPLRAFAASAPISTVIALHTMIFGPWSHAHRNDAVLMRFRCVLGALFPKHFAAGERRTAP